jgi:hypothetical protein
MHNKLPASLLKYQCRQKIDSDYDKSADFQFGSSQESKIEPPLVIDSVWYCQGITLDTMNHDDGKTIMGWRCDNCARRAPICLKKKWRKVSVWNNQPSKWSK